MSLRDQLLKAGLVSADAVKKAEAGQRKQSHQAKKGNEQARAAEARKAEEQKAGQQEAERKRSRDREIERQRAAERKRQEDLARARQLIEANRVNDRNAEDRYNFQEGRFVRSVRVSEPQRRQIAMGKLGIAKMDSKGLDFAIIPREVALKLQDFVPDRVLVLLDETDQFDDDPWAGWDSE